MEKILLFRILIPVIIYGCLACINAFAVDCGPSGGTGGGDFHDGAIGGEKIAEVRIRSGVFIDAVQILYRPVGVNTENLRSLSQHGGSGGTLSIFKLASDEHIISVGGRYGNYIDSFWIKTNKGRSQTWGGSGGGVNFSYTAPQGWMINSFFGRSGNYLDAIGVNFTPIQ